MMDTYLVLSMERRIELVCIRTTKPDAHEDEDASEGLDEVVQLEPERVHDPISSDDSA